MLALVVDNSVKEELRSQFFNKVPPDGTRLSKIAHYGRKEWLSAFYKELDALDPAQATASEIATTIAVLICAGIPQALIAETLQTSKTTISRWLNMEAPPRPISREIIITRSKGLLKTILNEAKVA